MPPNRDPILNDSPPAEQQRHEALERYNESTFGERRPITAAFLEFALFVAIGILLACFLPRGIFFGLSLLLLFVLFRLWRWRKQGWTPPTWDALHRPRQIRRRWPW